MKLASMRKTYEFKWIYMKSNLKIKRNWKVFVRCNVRSFIEGT